MRTRAIRFSSKSIPLYLVIIWLNGFCTTRNQMKCNQRLLTVRWLCVEEFYQAYDFCSLVQLFSSKSINLEKFNLQLTDFLANAPLMNKSFWNLNRDAQGYYNTSSFNVLSPVFYGKSCFLFDNIIITYGTPVSSSYYILLGIIDIIDLSCTTCCFSYVSRRCSSALSQYNCGVHQASLPLLSMVC